MANHKPVFLFTTFILYEDEATEDVPLPLDAEEAEEEEAETEDTDGITALPSLAICEVEGDAELSFATILATRSYFVAEVLARVKALVASPRSIVLSIAEDISRFSEALPYLLTVPFKSPMLISGRWTRTMKGHERVNC